MLDVRGLTKSFAGFVAVDGVSLAVAKESLALAAAKLPVKTRFVERISE